MHIDIKQLIHEIESCRKRMISLAATSSLDNSQVIEASVELDRLIYKYHTIKHIRSSNLNF